MTELLQGDARIHYRAITSAPPEPKWILNVMLPQGWLSKIGTPEMRKAGQALFYLFYQYNDRCLRRSLKLQAKKAKFHSNVKEEIVFQR